MPDFQLFLGDCLDILPTLEASSIDSICTDPPYGYNFMGKNWDHGVPGVPFWEAALRVAKPGAHLLAFGGTRTFHRLTVAIEDAGWEIRDVLSWNYGSGFPKSHDISKAIDKAAGAEREVVGEVKRWGANASGGRGNQNANGYQPSVAGAEKFDPVTAPATDDAKRWDGWGTALKPAWEPVLMARKPLSEPTIAANVLKWGTGGINVDGCRIGTQPGDELTPRNNKVGQNGWKNSSGGYVEPSPLGRWPANLLLDEEAAAILDEQTGVLKSGAISSHHKRKTAGGNGLTHGHMNGVNGPLREADSGGASRFFYISKASKSDRGEGNNHPTVKPTDLLRYLIRLITPPGGIVLDPFVGSGSTLKAAILEGFDCAGIDLDPDYLAIARARVEDEKQKAYP